MSRSDLLIVDDDRIITMLHHRFGINSGLHPSPRLFYSGQDALNYIRNNSGNTFIILLDINMPSMSGWEFLDQLYKEDLTSRVRVVIVTSSVDSADMERANTYDIVVDYIDKPLDFQKMEDILKHFP